MRRAPAGKSRVSIVSVRHFCETFCPRGRKTERLFTCLTPARNRIGRVEEAFWLVSLRRGRKFMWMKGTDSEHTRIYVGMFPCYYPWVGRALSFYVSIQCWTSTTSWSSRFHCWILWKRPVLISQRGDATPTVYLPDELGYASWINQKEWPGVISVSIPPRIFAQFRIVFRALPAYVAVLRCHCPLRIISRCAMLFLCYFTPCPAGAYRGGFRSFFHDSPFQAKS